MNIRRLLYTHALVRQWDKHLELQSISSCNISKRDNNTEKKQRPSKNMLPTGAKLLINYICGRRGQQSEQNLCSRTGPTKQLRLAFLTTVEFLRAQNVASTNGFLAKLRVSNCESATRGCSSCHFVGNDSRSRSRPKHRRHRRLAIGVGPLPAYCQRRGGRSHQVFFFFLFKLPVFCFLVVAMLVVDRAASNWL